MDLSLDDIQQLSPDDASFKAAKGLVIPAKWPLLAVNDSALWGECQGSGSKPYQVQVDKSGPAFKCSCPSRKFPCKHGLALLLLRNQHADKFTQTESPSWVNDWVNSRHEKTETKAAKKAEAESTPADPAAKAKREQNRQQRMLAGLDELELWLKDQIRQGLAQLNSQKQFGEQLAARMVDAQLSGIAYRIRQWPAIIMRNNLWPENVLAEFGQLQLLIDGVRRLHELPESTQADLYSILGVATDKETLLNQGEKISDAWLVLGQHVFEQDRLWVRRVWLRARISGRFALLLDFSHGTRNFEQVFLTGSWINADLIFYPGNSSLRAMLVDKPTQTESAIPAEPAVSENLDALARQFAANPWQTPQPFMLTNVLPHYENNKWTFIAHDGETFSGNLNEESAWQLLAESGGKPLNIFGEWEANQIKPLSAWRNEFLWSAIS